MEFCWSFAGVLLEFCWSFAEIRLEFFKKISEVLLEISWIFHSLFSSQSQQLI